MEQIFMKLLNMSFAASWLMLAVFFLRFCLKRAPKWITCLLWGLAALRLVCPFSFRSALSILPSAQVIDPHNVQFETPAIHTGIQVINSAVNPILADSFAPSPMNSANPFYILMYLAGLLWAAGLGALLLYAAFSYLRVHRSVREKVPLRENIYLCDNVKSPFILGVFRPKIFLPSDLYGDSEEFVITHEKAHIARLDHLWKPLGFLVLAIHWFNPLCWISYVLLCRDIELACDERVIRSMNLSQKKAYSAALLECSVQRRLVTVCPLAFGEIGVKERVKSILSYKKPAFWLMIVAIAACAAAAVCFLTDPVEARESASKLTLSQLTLEDVVRLSKKGDELSLADFQQYPYTEGGFGLHISTFEIDDRFFLRIGDNGQFDPKATAYIYLLVRNETNDFIDIRTGNVSSFIEAHKNDEIVSPSSTDIGGVSEPAEAADEASPLEAAISNAVLEHYSSSRRGDIACESHVILAAEGLSDAAEDKLTKHVYLLSLYEEYSLQELGLETVTGSLIPIALTFELEGDNEYRLTEYWEPREGEYYANDIREKFPKEAAKQALDHHDYALSLTQACYDQAVNYSSLDTNAVIEHLLNTIMSSPDASSSPAAYLIENNIEYRKLLYYGDHTLRYCFDRFLGGGQTNLQAHIMRQLINDLAPELAIADRAKTPQESFDRVLETTRKTQDKHGAQWMQENMPRGWLLLQREQERTS